MTLLHRRSVVQGIGATALALSAGVVGARGQGQPTPRRGGSINVAVTQGNAKTFDPMLSIQPDERQLLYLVYNGLVAIAPDYSLEPELATSWKIENDGKRYVMELREGVLFHDGTPFNAEAVKYNIEKRLDPAMNSPQRSQIGPAIASVEVLGTHRVAINLNFIYPTLLAEFGDRVGFMVSPTAHQKFGADYSRNPVGTGPFTLKEWVVGSHISLERNQNYYLKDKPYLDAVHFRYVPNVAIGAQRLNIGEIDYLDRFGPSELPLIDRSKGVKATRFSISRWYTLGWRHDKPPFNNLKLRQAIAYGIDRERINQIVQKGEAAVANGMSGPGLWWSNPPKPAWEYSVEKAKALLKESGYNLDEPLTLAAPADPNYNKISTLTAEMMEQIGLKMRLTPLQQAQYFSMVVNGDVNWGPLQWNQRADPDAFYYALLHSKGANNTPKYNNPEMDKLLDQARQTLDQTTRRQLYGEAEQLMLRDVAYLPIFFSADYVAVSGRMQDFPIMPDQQARFRYVWVTS